MKPPEFQTINCLAEPWQTNFAEPVTPWQTSSENKQSSCQGSFAKPLPHWQTNSWECKELTWQDNFANPLSSWQDSPVNRISTLQDILTKPHSPWQGSCTHPFSSWQGSFTKPLSSLQESAFEHKEPIWQDISTKSHSPRLGTMCDHKKSIWQNHFTNPFSWQDSPDNKESALQDIFTRPVYPLQENTCVHRQYSWQTSFTKPLSPWGDNTDNKETMMQDIFTRPLSPWQDINELTLQDIFTIPLSPWQNIPDIKESMLEDIFTRPFSPWQDIPDINELTRQDILTRPFSPWQDIPDINELTRQDSFTESISSCQVSSCELKETTETTAYPYTQMSKDRYLSTLGLLPRNGAKQVCETKSPTCQNTDLNEYIPKTPTLPNTAECLMSNLTMNQENSPEVKSVINRNRCPLILSICSRNNKRYVKSVDYVEEKLHEVDNLEGNLQTLRIKSLYRLDVTSPLGQLVIQHFKSDPSLHILSNTESHCLTSAPITSSEINRLRERNTTYPITFKGVIGKFNSSHVHQYRFTRLEKVEFMSRVNSGLDKKSRSLFKSMKPCKVRLSQITKSELKRWMVSPCTAIVELTPLSLKDISYWTSPKADTNTNCSALLVNNLAQPSSQVQKIKCAEAPDGFNCNRYNQNNVTLPEQIFLCENTSKKAEYENVISEVINFENEAPKSENLSLLEPSIELFTFRKILSSDLHKNPIRQVNCLPDLGKITIGLIKLCQDLSLPIKNAKLIENDRSYRAVSRKYLTRRRQLGSPKHSSPLDHSEKRKPGRPRKVWHRISPVRSGIYNVHIFTSGDGTIIRSFLDNEAAKKLCK